MKQKVPLYNQKNQSLRGGLTKFDVEINVLKSGRLVPFEIYRPERFIVEKQKNNEENGTR